MRRREEELDMMAIVQDIAARYPTRIQGRPSLGGRADIVVSKGSKKIVVELKNRPISLLDIRRLLQSRQPRGAYRIIAVSRDAWASTSGSVFDYAERARIAICDLNELPSVIDRL